MLETTVKHVWLLWRATSLIPDFKQHVNRTRSFPKGFRSWNIFSRAPDLHALLNHCKIKGLFLFYKKQTVNKIHIAWIAIANFVKENQHVYAIHRKKKIPSKPWADRVYRRNSAPVSAAQRCFPFHHQRARGVISGHDACFDGNGTHLVSRSRRIIIQQQWCQTASALIVLHSTCAGCS